MAPLPPLPDRILTAFSPSRTPADLLVVYFWTIVSIAAVYLPMVNESPARVVLALPMILFFPGYALIAALFPGEGEIDALERLALSFGLSIAVAPLIGLALNYTPWGIRLDPIVICLVLFTIAMGAIAQYRRSLLPKNEQFRVPFRRVFSSVQQEFLPREGSRTDRILSAILLVAIVAAGATTIYVIAVPKEGEKFTEFYILGEERKAAEYPTDLVAGEPGSIIIGIGNHEYRNATYVVELYEIDQESDPVTNASVIRAMEKVSSWNVLLPHNTTFEESRPFTLNSTGTNQLKFLLFIDQAPPDSLKGMDRINESYRDL
ncbi:MAG: DUF1616 domain-containing protein, partial [Methanolinea sp.]|nr:DUF1616 domain-containing protein [Methanolinea sp.]